MHQTSPFAIAIATALAVAFASPVASENKAAEVATEDAAADIATGEKLYKKQCRQCHGPTAKGLASYPTLRGQSAEQLAEVINAYRRGEKRGPNTPLMAPNARKLSDQQVLDVSAFIASLD